MWNIQNKETEGTDSWREHSGEGGGGGRMEEEDYEVQSPSYKMNMSQGCHVQHEEYSQSCNDFVWRQRGRYLHW